MLIVASMSTATSAASRRDLGYVLLIVWAFAGMPIQQPAFAAVAVPAQVLVAVVLLGATLIGRLRKPSPRATTA